MLSAYPACFFKEGNQYSVIFPDLNNLSTKGDSLDDALVMAVDCLAGYLYLLEQDGGTAPKATSMEKVNPSLVAKELKAASDSSFVNMITVDVAAYAKMHFEKSVKKTLTIPAWLNTAALQQNINFSQVLQDALKEKLEVG